MRNISYKYKYSFRIIRKILKICPHRYINTLYTHNNTITMNNSGGEPEKNRMHLARGRNTSSFGFFASFEQLQGSCVILAN